MAVQPIPQSVINADIPYTSIPDYNDGYALPRLPVAPESEPWVQAPLPLPASIINADQPWQTHHNDINVTNSFEDIALRHGRNEEMLSLQTGKPIYGKL